MYFTSKFWLYQLLERSVAQIQNLAAKTVNAGHFNRPESPKIGIGHFDIPLYFNVHFACPVMHLNLKLNSHLNLKGAFSFWVSCVGRVISGHFDRPYLSVYICSAAVISLQLC